MPQKPRPTSTRRAQSRARSAGFSILEILVSIIVVTMGLLGLAGMSMRSLAANDSSAYRAAASISALQIADLIRANRLAASEGRYDKGFADTAPSAGNAKSIADVAAWTAALQQLPAGRGSIQYDGGTRLVTVTVRWDDTRGAQSSTETPASLEQTYAYTFRP